MDLDSLTPEQLEQLNRDPDIGEPLKERIRKVLHGAIAVKKQLHAMRLRTLEQPAVAVIPWSALASDNLRKGIAGEANREKQERYGVAIARLREHIREQLGDAPYRGPVQVNALFWFPDNRPRDPWNFQKEILDGMKGLAIVDDKWQELRRVTFEAGGVDVDRPRCEITLAAYTRSRRA